MSEKAERRWTLEHSSVTLVKVHSNSKCAGEYCTIHNLSDHHMRPFPQNWRGDRGIMERICTHGVGHPDPDEYMVKLYPHEGVHGCDGCCTEGGYEALNGAKND